MLYFAGLIARSLIWGAVPCLALLYGAELRAQPAGPILLSYRAPDACPDAAELQRSVERRAPSLRFVDEGSHERELSIVMRTAGSATIGELRLVEPDGHVRQRSVRFTSCAEAVEGMALIAAVSLGPQSNSAPKDPAPAPFKPSAPEAPKSALPVATPAVVEPAPRSLRRARFGLGAELSARFGVFPQPAPGVALFGDWESTLPNLLAPLLRLELGQYWRRGVPANQAKANFALSLATLSLCPLRIASGLLELRPCASFSGGVLHVSASETQAATARTRPYWAWGGSLWLFAHASERLDITGNLGLGTPLVADRYVLDQVELWKTPALYVSSGVGLRLRLE